MTFNFAANLLKKLIPGLKVPHGLRIATPSELASLLPYSHPILEARDRSVEDRALVLHVGVGESGLWPLLGRFLVRALKLVRRGCWTCFGPPRPESPNDRRAFGHVCLTIQPSAPCIPYYLVHVDVPCSPILLEHQDQWSH